MWGRVGNPIQRRHHLYYNIFLKKSCFQNKQPTQCLLSEALELKYFGHFKINKKTYLLPGNCLK